MALFDVMTISVALALDASGVALSLGLDERITKGRKLLSIISFGFFQFLFVFIGGLFGYFFNTYIYSLPSIVGGIIILAVGILMFREGFSKEEKFDNIKWYIILILGISVSIDALVVGFSTFNNFLSNYILFKNSLIVGIITSLLTAIAFLISKTICKICFIKKYSDFLAGIILILFGIKMIFF